MDSVCSFLACGGRDVVGWYEPPGVVCKGKRGPQRWTVLHESFWCFWGAIYHVIPHSVRVLRQTHHEVKYRHQVLARINLICDDWGMAASSLTTIFCDGCGVWEDSGIASTASIARAQLRRVGWQVRQQDTNQYDSPVRRDWCPKCKTDKIPGAGFQ